MADIKVDLPKNCNEYLKKYPSILFPNKSKSEILEAISSYNFFSEEFKKKTNKS